MSSNVAPDSGTEVRSEIPAWSEDPLTARARAVWTAGDFHRIALAYVPGAEAFVARLALSPDESVLDVACGTGNLALPAARAGANVTGIDIAPNLIAQARLEARGAGRPIHFEVGDAEALPYAGGRFDTTMTMFGAMFAYRPEKAAAEMLRVTKSGGRVAMANWTPEGFVGKLLRAHVAVVPPPAGVPSPLGRGDPEVVRARYGSRVASLTLTKRTIEFRFPFPPSAAAELFAAYYGPTVTTLRAADPERASGLRTAIARLFDEHNRGAAGTTLVESEYLDVQARVA